MGLEDLSLQILTLDLGEPSEFLSKALNPPSTLAMGNSLRLLESLGAVECKWLDSDSKGDAVDCSELAVSTELTALGFHLSSLPVGPRIGKLMIYGALLGCVEAALTIASSMTTSKPLFVSPFGQRDEADQARREIAVDNSDHLTMLCAFDEWRRIRRAKGDRAARSFIGDHFLNRMTLFEMEDLRKHYADLLVGIGFLPKGYRSGGKSYRSSSSETGSDNDFSLIKAVLVAGLYPNVIVAPRSLIDGSGNQEAGENAFRSQNKGDVYLHPSTVSFHSKQIESRYCCFHEIMKTSKMYIRDMTPISPVALLLFGGAIKVYHEKEVITVDEWLRFRISRTTASQVRGHVFPASHATVSPLTFHEYLRSVFYRSSICESRWSRFF